MLTCKRLMGARPRVPAFSLVSRQNQRRERLRASSAAAWTQHLLETEHASAVAAGHAKWRALEEQQRLEGNGDDEEAAVEDEEEEEEAHEEEWRGRRIKENGRVPANQEGGGREGGRQKGEAR
jgi:hypothetical protein